jgi:hypothetical protein
MQNMKSWYVKWGVWQVNSRILEYYFDYHAANKCIFKEIRNNDRSSLPKKEALIPCKSDLNGSLLLESPLTGLTKAFYKTRKFVHIKPRLSNS